MRLKTAFARGQDIISGLTDFDLDRLGSRHGHKELVGLRLDDDVVAFFRSAGAGWQTRVNAVLRHVMVASARTPEDV